MVDLSKEIDFSALEEKHPGIRQFVQKAAQQIYEELPSDEKIKKPYVEKDFSDYIIVCGLPQVDNEKLEKLKRFFIQKILTKVGVIDLVRSDPAQPRMWGKQQDGELTNGCVILDFKSVDQAERAIRELNGVVFDKKHTISAFSFADYSKVFQLPDEFTAPLQVDQTELEAWQQTKDEQFVYQNGSKVYLYDFFHLNQKVTNALGEADDEGEKCIKLSGSNKTQWSPNGTYLVEFLETGFQLYGGKQMQKLNFYQHKGVKNIAFSAKEDYILSYNGNVLQSEDSENYIVWNLKQVNKIRAFKAPQEDKWGGMKFNFDGSLIARIEAHMLYVYKTNTMELLKQSNTDVATPIIVKNIQYFEWVNGINTVFTASYAGQRAYNEDELKNLPTRLQLIELPSRRETKWKHISYESQDVQLLSENTGAYGVVVLKKLGKNKKLASTIVHVANFQNRGSVEITDFEFPVSEGTFKSISLEPKSGKLAVVLEFRASYQAKVVKTDYNIFLFEIKVQRERRGLNVQKLQAIRNKRTPELQWSSNGEFFGLVNKDKESSEQGILELGFLQKNKDKKFEPEIFKMYDNISYMTYSEWDPTGRLVITGSESTNSYHIYNALGELLYKQTVNKDGLQLCCFRPRKENLISIQSELKIVKDIKPDSKIWKDWTEEDEKIVNAQKYEEKRRLEKQKNEIEEYLKSKRDQWNSSKKERIQLRGFDEENFAETTEYTVLLREQILETKIQEEEIQEEDEEEEEE